jgi:Cu-Zn family superoxide dismutase
MRFAFLESVLAVACRLCGVGFNPPRSHFLPIAWSFNMTMQTHFLRTISGVALAALMALPVLADQHAKGEHAEVALPKAGIAVMMPTKGNKVRGVLRLMQKGKDLHISGKIRNLTPGEHGFHIHEFGDLRGTDGKAAGGHFNPFGTDHGAPGEKSHVGDLGNITANADGVASAEIGDVLSQFGDLFRLDLCDQVHLTRLL